MPRFIFPMHIHLITNSFSDYYQHLHLYYLRRILFENSLTEVVHGCHLAFVI